MQIWIKYDPSINENIKIYTYIYIYYNINTQTNGHRICTFFKMEINKWSYSAIPPASCAALCLRICMGSVSVQKKTATPNSVLRCIELYGVYLLNISSTKTAISTVLDWVANCFQLEVKVNVALCWGAPRHFEILWEFYLQHSKRFGNYLMWGIWRKEAQNRILHF